MIKLAGGTAILGIIVVSITAGALLSRFSGGGMEENALQKALLATHGPENILDAKSDESGIVAIIPKRGA